MIVVIRFDERAAVLILRKLTLLWTTQEREGRSWTGEKWTRYAVSFTDIAVGCERKRFARLRYDTYNGRQKRNCKVMWQG